ncbi:uncharacterized protein LOC144582018 isoform X2 [Callithrix jacchus]
MEGNGEGPARWKHRIPRRDTSCFCGEHAFPPQPGVAADTLRSQREMCANAGEEITRSCSRSRTRRVVKLAGSGTARPASRLPVDTDHGGGFAYWSIRLFLRLFSEEKSSDYGNHHSALYFSESALLDPPYRPSRGLCLDSQAKERNRQD